ncbi:MAG: right-handed parallel beta-helix repeat-containing protein [Acidobacteria bacterium]|nr:right-handed parallel beta-helix repeat-containing protein [Acidobacteriota bacterium]
MSRSRRRVAKSVKPIAVAAGALGITALAAPVAQAATFTVTNLNDSGAGSLRDAIASANGAAGADTITFQSGLTGTITLTSGQLEVTDSVDIQGPGPAALTVSGNNSSRVFYLYSGGSLLDISISGLTVSGGNADDGGGISDSNENLTLNNMVISGNHATDDGGGLWMDGFDFHFTIRNTTISGNSATGDGGGIYIEDTNDESFPNLFEDVVLQNNTARNGAGIYLYDPDSPITLNRMTISGNMASQLGGGIHLQDTDSDSTFTITNSTISGNSAPKGGGIYFYQPDNPVLIRNTTISGNNATAGPGGGVYFYDAYAGVTLEHVTIASNTAVGDGGGFFVENNTVDVVNSIVANNTGAANADIGGNGTVNIKESLVEAPSTVTVDGGGNITGTDPNLGPLANNGGTTQTHLPQPGSPAIDAGDQTLTPTVTTDQRGTTRPVGANVDMGAVEVNGGTIVFNPVTYNVNENAGTVTLTVTRTGGTDPATVQYATANGSATAGSDYTTSTGTVTFAAGQTSQTFSVPILDDTAVEGPETFTVSLSNPMAASLGAQSTATVTINDIEPGTIQFSSATYSVNENGGVLTVTVTRTGGSTGTVSANYATSNGSATAGSDYTATSGTVTFGPGVTSQTFNVPILTDLIVEGPETFNLTLSAPTGGATLGSPTTSVATIIDAVVAVPDLGPIGKMFLMFSTAMIALFALAKRRLFGIVLALFAVGIASHSLHAAPAPHVPGQAHAKHLATQREQKKDKVHGTVASVQMTKESVKITLRDGSSTTIARSALKLRDQRPVRANAKVAAPSLQVGQEVVIRTHRNADGSVKRVVVKIVS